MIVGGTAAPRRAQAQRPLGAAASGDIVLTGDWLQANALPLDRQAMHSAAFTASYRRERWTADAGFLRIARDLSTIQGGTLAFGIPLRFRQALFIPSIAGLAGQAQASRDSTGYDFIDPQGVAGHQPRYSYSSAATFGGGIGLALELPVYRWIGFRADVAQWFFSGAPLENDRARTTVGVGLSLRVWR
jgi:hypothetical protein